MLYSIHKSTLALIFSIFMVVLKAQTYFGLHTGAAMTHFKVKEERIDLSNDWVAGVNSGLHFDFGINKRLAIQSGVDFYQKGYARRNRYLYRITYLDLSVLMKFKTYDIKYNKKGKKFGIYGLFGPYAGLSLYGRQRDKEKGTSKKYEPYGEQKRNIGLLAGVGAMFPMKKGHYFFDINYNYCVSEVVGASDSYAYRGYVARLGYSWKL